MSKAAARHKRSVAIGVLALASLVWVATDSFGIPPENIAWLFVYIAAGALGVILAAAVVVGLWIALRRLIGRS